MKVIYLVQTLSNVIPYVSKAHKPSTLPTRPYALTHKFPKPKVLANIVFGKFMMTIMAQVVTTCVNLQFLDPRII